MSAVWAALVNGAILSAALGAAVWIALRLAPRRRWNAATRYVIWWIALAVTLALPAAGLLRPRVRGTELRIPAVEYRGGGAAAAPVRVRGEYFPLRVPAGAWLGWLFGGWAVCSGVFLRRLILSYAALRRIEGEGVVHSTRVSIPMAVGQRILIPAALIDALSGSDLEQVVRHEAAHLQRRDDRWLLVQRVVEALYPLRPVVRWIARQIDLEREIACDDLVAQATNDPRGYAACLTRMVELCGGVRRSPAGVNFADGRSHLTRRVELLMKRTQDARTNLFKSGLAASAIVLAATGWLLVKTPAVVALAAPQGRGTPAVNAPPNGARLLALLFDTASMSKDDLARATAAASRLVETRLKSDERVGILVFNGARLVVRQDFTDDRVKLEQAIEELAGEATGGGTGNGLAGIQQAIAILTPVEGKKALVYLSAGRSFVDDPQLQMAIFAAVKGGVAIYQVDARGEVSGRVVR
jgi:hypothetical protein